MGLSVPGARQVWKHHRFLPLANTELQSGEALPGQDAERFEGLGEAGGHQHGQSSDLRYRDFRTEGRRQMSRENGPSTGQVSEQRRRSGSWQAEATDPSSTGFQNAEDRLRDHHGI